MASRPATASLPGGLRLLPRDGRAAALSAAAAVVGVSAFVLALDAWLFRDALAPEYIRYFTSPLIPRTPVTCVLASIEEVKFRLIVMTALVAVVAWLRGNVTPAWFVAIILAAQFINVGPLVFADPVYATLRYWLVGSVWGWLYWRQGFLAAFAGHGLSHLLLDPLLLRALQP